MQQTLLTYYGPNPGHSGMDRLSMAILTKEHALAYAHDQVGKPVGNGMTLYLATGFEDIPEANGTGRIFMNYDETQPLPPSRSFLDDRGGEVQEGSTEPC